MVEHHAIRQSRVRPGLSGRGALLGLLLVQAAIGYEWLASGLSKLIRGDFPAGLAANLQEESQGAAGWYRSFLDAAVIPNGHAFGYAIEISEVITGLLLIVAALTALLAWERLPGSLRAAALLATTGAALAGIVMAVNFHLAMGGANPWGIPAGSFDEAVDLDSLIVALQLVLLVVSVRALLSGHRAPDVEEPSKTTKRKERRPRRCPRKEMVAMQIQSQRTSPLGRRVLWALAPLATGLALGGAFLGGGAGASAASPSAAATGAKATALQLDARQWQQLVSIFKPAGPAPFNLRSMSDHRVLVLPSGYILALHFDNMNLAKVKNLNWIALGVPGVFTKADQARVTRQFGPGFTHFHDLARDTHGGKPGAKGAWFVHVGVRNFTSPFGKVRQGQIDSRFMPTPPRS